MDAANAGDDDERKAIAKDAATDTPCQADHPLSTENPGVMP